MPLKAKAPPLAAPYNWTGFYVGANVGYSVGRDPSAFASAFFGGAESFSLQPAGAIGGGQVGYNWQRGHWVLGIEADIQASGQKDSACVTRCLVGSIGATIDQEMPGSARCAAASAGPRAPLSSTSPAALPTAG